MGSPFGTAKADASSTATAAIAETVAVAASCYSDAATVTVATPFSAVATNAAIALDSSSVATMATGIANAASETATASFANAATETAAIASGSSSGFKRYDVFLSFSGEIRRTFISQLYKALTEKGINTFKDDKNLDQGETISLALLKAIEKSRFCLVVLSKDYASSSWCLQELEKITERIPDAEKDKETDVKKDAKIDAVKDKKADAKKDSKTVLPIFYHVDPSEVRKQNGKFGVGFNESKQKCPAKEQDWKSALTKVANQSGWDARDRDEVILIDEIVIFILKKLSRTSSKMPSHLLGMESRVKDMESRLQMGLDNVRMVGIWGMPGIGKTTIAKAVYDSINCKFDSCCFLEKVGEVAGKSGVRLPSLQEQLVSKLLKEEIRTIRTLGDNFDAIKTRFKYMRVLIVLDDVDHGDQLRALVGEHEWFGLGSRIIITTTDLNLLTAHGVDETYKPACLNHIESLWLFTRHALKNSHSIDKFTKFMELSHHIVKCCEGVPKVLQLLGSFLVDKNELEWESELQKFQIHLNMQIRELYEKIYDHRLDWQQKEMSLDIACFFNGEDKDYVVKVLEGFGHYRPHSDLRVLIDKSIITNSDNKYWMNGLLQKMGRHIVHLQSPENPGLRSRLWRHNDVCRVLATNTATDKIMGIILDLSKIRRKLNIDTEVFWRMNKLKLLKIYFADHSVGFEYDIQKQPFASINFSKGTDALRLPNSRVNLYGELVTLSNDLVSLHWHGYPLEYLPRHFYPEQLVELNMSCSRIKKFWTKAKYFEKLKFIKLSHSQQLTVTPDFSGMPNLEILILEGCTNLIVVHQSLSYLKRLVLLNLKDCSRLQKLPSEISMISLEVLVLSGCSELKTFPEIKGKMRSLSELHLDDTAIEALPESITQLKGLVLLSARNCKYLEHLPSSFGCLKRLKTINLSGCTHFDQLLEKLKWLKNLEELYVEGVTITQIPFSICHYAKLKVLSFRGCENFPFVNAEQTLQEETRENFSPYFYGRLSCLTSLDLSYCNLKCQSLKTLACYPL